VSRALGEATVIHLATHGIVRDDDPFGSFLALGVDGGDGHGDGTLTAEEIYGLRLQAQLVVLSACRSGLGEVSSDGIVGLTRAFFFAGTPRVVATLWDVADGPSAQLLRDFYAERTRKADLARALRAAQLRMLANLRAGVVRAQGDSGARLPERPALWAGFVLVGEP
jgi:CHAT domain-containing protein